jgi:hypothetical protein
MLMNLHAEFANQVSLVKPCGIHLIGVPIELNAEYGFEDDYLIIIATLPIVARSSGTVQLGLASDDSMAVATDGSAPFHIQSKIYQTNITPIPKGSLAVLPMPVRTRHCGYRRFLGLLMTVTDAAISGGEVTAFLTQDRDSWQLNPAKA